MEHPQKQLLRSEDIIPNIVSAIAEARGVDSYTVDKPLHDVVDTEALRQLLLSGGNDLLVSFVYEEYNVRVRGDGHVEVTEQR